MQWHKHRAAATGGDLVETVIEELSEDSEERVVRWRKADVGGHVRDEQRLAGRHTIDWGAWSGARHDACVALRANGETSCCNSRWVC